MKKIKIKLKSKRVCISSVVENSVANKIINEIIAKNPSDLIDLGEIVFFKKDIKYILVKSTKWEM